MGLRTVYKTARLQFATWHFLFCAENVEIDQII
jgi:hypothetical protein